MISTPKVTGTYVPQTGRPAAGPAAGKPVIYFSRFLPLSHRSNARELVENTLFYHSAQRFDVFSCFSSHMSRKPAILRESLERIEAAFADRPAVVLKELGAGHGESMVFLLNEARTNHPALFNKLTACASDGFQPIVEELKRSPALQPFMAAGKLVAAHEDLLGELPCRQAADHVRISYTLSDLPEDLVRKENGQFLVAHVRGYLTGQEDLVTDRGVRFAVKQVADLLATENVQALIDLGLDIRDIQPRVGYEVEYRPIDYSVYAEGWLVQRALAEITAGIQNTDLRLGLSAAQAIEKVLAAHLKGDPGSRLEIFDLWTKEILPDMPAPVTGLDFTSVNSVNFPFIRAYLRARGGKFDLKFEDWKEYIGQTGPYIYLSHFAKWLKGSPAEVNAFFERPVPAATVDRIVDFLERTKHVADMVLTEEKADHPFCALLRREGFSDREIDRLFTSQMFPEPDKSRSRGFYGLYQVVTITRQGT
jgi:hypothetical protein